jgi:hypothetical protein
MDSAIMIPVLPGKRDALLAFANALMGERREELDKAQVTVTKESWHLQETPMGDFCIVYFEAPDALGVHSGLAASEEPFDVWFREQIKEVSGIDISTPPEAVPTRIFNWSRS